jgi:hypothetical protein
MIRTSVDEGQTNLYKVFADPQGDTLLYDGCHSAIALSVARCHPDGLITFNTHELQAAYQGDSGTKTPAPRQRG